VLGVRGGIAWLVALACALALPATALAAEPAQLPVKPFTLSADPHAKKPNVAVDEAGTGHFLWDVDVPYPASDPSVYCRVPRGASACQKTLVFNLPLESFGEPQVLTPGGGQVILLTYRCCGDGEGTYAIVSGDGGETFGAPHVIGKVEPGQAVYGPGTGVVSLADDVVTAGIHYQAAPLDGFVDHNANVGNGPGLQGYDGTIGFPAPTTPIVAFDDLTTAFFRAWSGAGDVNDLGTWGPIVPIGPLKELRIATGPKGVVLMGKEHADNPYRDVYTARRFDPATGTFGASTPISDPKVETDVIFRDIFEDGGGNIAAAFIANGTHSGKTDPMRYRASVDGGKTWRPERTLVAATEDNAFNLQMGAAPDGGGFVAYDGNGKGPLKAVAIPKLSDQGGATGGAGCVPTVSFGKVQAIALSGCLKKHSDGSYTSGDPVRFNGLDLVPKGSAGSVEIDPVHKQIKTKSVDVRAGNIVLDKGSFDWDVPAGTAALTTFSHLEKFHVSILGFPVAGEATLTLTEKGARIPAHLELPGIFGGVNGDVTLKLENPGGLQLEGFKIHVGDAFLGALEVKPLDVVYSNGQPPIFEGKARFLLPPTYSEPGVSVGFGFVNGKFKHAEGSFPAQLALFPPWLYLQKIGLALSTDPLKIAGGVLMTGGPQILGSAAISIDALPESSGGFTFELGKPSILRLAGSMSVVSVPFAHGFVEYRTNGLLKFGGGLDFTAPLGAAQVVAGIPEGPPLGPGFVDLTDGRFNAPFKGSVCVPAGCGFINVGAEGVVSSSGIAACGQFTVTPVPKVEVSAGFGYHWGGSPEVFADLGGCDVGPYAVSAGGRAHAAQLGTTVNVKAGLPQENIVVQGSGGAPQITVTGPGRETVSSTPGGLARSAHMVVFSNAAASRTYVLIGKPPAGDYSIATLPGSPAIAAVRHADGLPAPSVKARLGGRGYRRTLRYTIKTIAGQKVRFLERAGGVGSDLGEGKGSSGTLRFAPAEGPAGKRQIVALVEQNAIPRREIVVASYTAPPPRRPARPSRVRLKRSGSGVRVTWGPAARAARYVVRVRLHDGTSRLFTVRAKKRSLKVPGVARRTFGSVTVAGLTRSGLAGPSRKASVKRKVAKHKRRR
jgi:hypothetical protein